ncbi:hypothetical protein JVU11DRAFT_10397 [Chiua virens]|nr:hypothetical protein JVU11DRAFT_10397 [Chiua virens]
MIPYLDPPENTNLHVSIDLGNGYTLLPNHNWYLTTVQGEEARLICQFLGSPYAPKIWCWACLHLPSGQIAHLEYQELQKAPENVWMAQNVKILLDRRDRFADMQYFVQLAVTADQVSNDEDHEAHDDNDMFINLALVTLYSNPLTELLEKSYGVVISCTKLGEESLQIMFPHLQDTHGSPRFPSQSLEDSFDTYNTHFFYSNNNQLPTLPAPSSTPGPVTSWGNLHSQSYQVHSSLLLRTINHRIILQVSVKAFQKIQSQSVLAYFGLC